MYNKSVSYLSNLMESLYMRRKENEFKNQIRHKTGNDEKNWHDGDRVWIDRSKIGFK